MKATDVISSLKAHGVELWQEGDSLRYRARLGVLTEQDKATLKRHKAAILQLLKPPLTVPTTTAGSEPVATATVVTEPFPDRTEANRAAMPHIASMIDAFRSMFDADQVKVVFAEENGVRLGRPPQDTATCQHCRHWQGTKSGRGFCCSGFAPPVVRQVNESCEQFTKERRA